MITCREHRRAKWSCHTRLVPRERRLNQRPLRATTHWGSEDMRIVWGLEISNLLFITPQKHTIKLSPLQVQIMSEIQIIVLFFLPSFLHSWTLLHPPAVLLPTKIIEVRRISSLWKLKANINLVSGSNRASPSLLHSHMWHLCLWVKILQTVSLLKPSSSTRSIIERSAASPCLSKVPHYETHRTAYPTRTQSVLVSHLHLIQSYHYHILLGRISSLKMSRNM